MTRQIILEQDDLHRPGFLLLAPFYRHGAATQTVAERREALEGWIDAAFITEVFLDGVLGAQKNLLQLCFFEAGGMDRAHLLYNSEPEEQTLPAKFERVTELELEGQRFQLGWRRGPQYPGVGASPMVWAAASFAMASTIAMPTHCNHVGPCRPLIRCQKSGTKPTIHDKPTIRTS